jgi:RNA polymerase sigma-70 factor (ECF subfamily)
VARVDLSQTNPAVPGVDERALIARLRAGENAAFEQLIRAYGGRLLAVARRFLPVEEDARDAVQEAFTSAFRSIERFEGNARLSTWLHRIVVNAALMKLRTRRRKPEQSIEDLLPGFLEDGHLERPVSPWRKSGLERLELDELRVVMHEKIQALPESYRNVLLLRDIEELDTQETAELMGISEGAVKTRLHRARLALRELLEPHFREESA